MITLLVCGLAVLCGVGLVLTLVDRQLEWTWRAIAAERRERWLWRQGGYRGEPRTHR